MKLHTVFVTYNRLELTKRAIQSYLVETEQHEVYGTLSVVDNGSNGPMTDHLAHWGRFVDVPVLLLGENRYPGYAVNRGWELAPPDATHFHRADNDFVFLPGWCDEAQRCFNANPRLGQLGLRTDEQEQHAKWNTGGNCIIRRELWDAGLRWDERPWPQLRDEIGPGHTEDSLMSPAVRKMGWEWGRVSRLCIEPISYEAEDDPDRSYYEQTWRDRGVYGW